MIVSQISYAWMQSRKCFQLNDEQMLKLVEHIVMEMCDDNKGGDLKANQFETIEGRKKFEEYF